MREDNYFSLVKPEYCLLKEGCKNFGNPNICKALCRVGDNMNYMLAMADIPKFYRDNQYLDIEKVQNPETVRFLYYLTDHLTQFVDGGFNAYFYGPSGTGKTSWAVAILLKHLRQSAQIGFQRTAGLFIDAPKTLSLILQGKTIFNNPMSDVIEDIKTCPLVIWDNFLEYEMSASELRLVQDLIYERKLNGLANIYTSTTEPENLKYISDKLHYDVFRRSSCIEFSGTNLNTYFTFSDLMHNDEDIDTSKFTNIEDDNLMGNIEDVKTD